MARKSNKVKVNVQQLFPEEHNSDLITLQTDGPYPLRVSREDPIFSAFYAQLHGGNILFEGPPGGGKSVRLEAITNPE
ncbi:MAG: hypothetical protein KKH68_03080, partial [Proteobacteria bacterium]|nr:hypothetical protein [Pseudomonadota bacterium]